jgi:hypothetical protein
MEFFRPVSDTGVFPESLPVRRCGINGFNLGIDRFVRDLFVFCPVRDQTSSKCIHRSLRGLGMTPDRENVLGRRDVVTDWQIELRRNRYMKLASDFLFGCCSSVPATHRRNYGQSNSARSGAWTA